MPGTTAPSAENNRKKLMVAGEVQSSRLASLFYFFPASSAETERQTQTLTGPGRLLG